MVDPIYEDKYYYHNTNFKTRLITRIINFLKNLI